MNTPLQRIVLTALLLWGAAAQAQDKNFHVFLCLGQSNMEGYPGIPEAEKNYNDPRFQLLAAVDFPSLGREQGKWYPAVPPLCRPNAGMSPADYFGRTLVAVLPAAHKVGVVNVSVGGCKIDLFEQTTFYDYVAKAPAWMAGALKAYGGNPYQRLVDMARVAQRSGVIKGILLHQGESNVGDPAWPAKVKSVYERLLADLGLSAADVPLLVGGLVPADQQGKCASMNAVIADLPKTIPTAHFVSSDGCEAMPDHLHFSPAGYRELGQRYAGTMLSLLGFPPAGATPPAPPRPDLANQLAEAEAAYALIVKNAQQWGVDTQQLGMIGCSAGAGLTMQCPLHSQTMPFAFIGPIYGAMGPVEVPKDAPLMFNSSPPMISSSKVNPAWSSPGSTRACRWNFTSAKTAAPAAASATQTTPATAGSPSSFIGST